MEIASRLDKLPPYLFLEISRKIQEKRAQGADVVSFGIGDPDIPTPRHVVDELKRTADVPANHRYPETDGLPELRESIARWYERRFGLSFDPGKEVLPLIGAKEGIGHMALCLIDPGDVALVPDPGYPVYGVGTMFAGGESHFMPLREERGWLPDLSAIPSDVARRATVMWLNYPQQSDRWPRHRGVLPRGCCIRQGIRSGDLPRRGIFRSDVRRLRRAVIHADGRGHGRGD